MGVSTIQDAKVLISSSRVPDRNTGLKELINILRHNRGKSTVDVITNKAYLALCDAIFQCMRDERSSLLRSKAKTPKHAALVALSATALRHVVSTGVRTFKATTVQIIIDTIIELLPGKNGVFIEPLAEDLPKALRGLLEYQPHVERLPKDCWDSTVDFCLDALDSFLAEPEPEPQNSWSTTASRRERSRTRTPFESTDLTASKSSLRDLPTRKPLPEAHVHTAEDLVHCLQSLTRASNAPLLEKAEPILSTLIQFLQRKTGRSHSAALAAVNSVLARTALHSTELTKRTVKDLLPVMKSMWSDPQLRDEILIVLMNSEAHLSAILAEAHEDTAAFELEALVDVLYNEYRRRKESSVLQFLEDEHLCFRRVGDAVADTHPLNTRAFSMETEHVRCESLWAVVSSIARFSYMLDQRKRALAQQGDDRAEGDGSLSKRVRTTYQYHEYLRNASNETRSSAKRAALQVLAFMLQEGPLREDDLQDTLERLTTCISDENPVHASWAMLALAAGAFQRTSMHKSLRPAWVSVWQSASRTVTSLSSSRAACHLMDVLLRLEVVPFAAISANVQSMLLSIELSGPAFLSEASSSFLTTVIQQRTAENPTHFNQTAERVMSWLLSKWTPSSWPDRTYSALNAHHCNARDLLGLIHACLDRPLAVMNPSPFLVLGPMSQTRIQSSLRHDLERYLLLLPDREPFQLQLDSKMGEISSSSSEHSPTHLEIKLLDYCISEVEKTRQRWKEWTQQNHQGITADMLRIIAQFCIVVSAVGTLNEADQRRVHTLNAAADKFTQSYADFLGRRDLDQYKVDSVIEICSKNLPDIRHLERLSASIFKHVGVFSLAVHLSKTLGSRQELKQSFHANDDDDDFMDMDDTPGSQLSGVSSTIDDVHRHDIQAASDIAALRANCSAYCQLVSQLTDDSTHERAYIPQGFVDYITSITEPALLRSRAFLKALVSSRFLLRRDSSMQLLTRLSEGLIDPVAREYNTSEVAHGMVIDILVATARDWDPAATDLEGQELYDMADALYVYYVKDMEAGGVRQSSNLQMALGDLLNYLLTEHGPFQKNRKSPSVRTSLFELLKSSDITVKYHIARRLPGIFESFILPEHEKIFHDIADSLPNDEKWSEGLAVALLVLGKLASRWYTLLRQGVFEIFAAAGSIEGTAQHARRCINQIASARDLGSAKALFRLLAPQIIFTWLDHEHTFSAIPFLAFDYPSLEALIRDVEAEAVGQALMLGKKEEIDNLAQLLKVSTSQLLTRNIGKANAYSISWDTCKGTARNKSEQSSMLLLRELVGPTQYAQLIQRHFPRIVGHILQTINHEERIVKSLDKRPPYSSTAKALKEMNNFSHSTEDFDLGIEPSFNAFYLFDMIERLCRRTNDDPVSFWKENNYTFIMRMLLDRLHPALGSLHARSVIRKVRILVALAGEVAYKGYPLQMTLQSLRPFLTDIQCAEDVFGIVQYLFEHGVEHLQSHLSFVTGIGLSILISTRVFLGSSQDSTTQESQHTAAMSKAQRFHGWLVRWLEGYSDKLDQKSSSTKAFRMITIAASQIRTEGNSYKDSEESKLLLQILDDVRSTRKLLNNTSREVALDLLCRNFQPAHSAGEDVLQSDVDIADYAPQVWQSCLRNNVGDGYMLWAARVLGRAFSAHGEVKRSTTQAGPWSIKSPSSKDPLGKTSRGAIIQKIGDVFYSDNRKEVGLAESAVRLLISRLSDSYARELSIPQYIGDALELSIPPEGEDESPALSETLGNIAYPATRKPPSIWIRDLAVALCHEAFHDPILSSISRLLLGIDGMAGALFPYILHLVLLGEFDGSRLVQKALSEAVTTWFAECDEASAPYVRTLIQAILYLRSQPVPKEVTRVDRDSWLDIDYVKASRAAAVCGMYRSALLFAETSTGQQEQQPVVKTSSRRSSARVQAPVQTATIPVELQLLIYKNLDEPDSFYGVDRGSSLLSVLDRLEHEADGVKSLLFRGARMDSQIRRSNAIVSSDSRGMMHSLINLNMNSITHSLLLNDQFRDTSDDVVDSTLHTARKLGQWDIKAPEGKHGEPVTLFKAFQGLHYASDVAEAKWQLDRQMLATMKLLSSSDRSSSQTKSHLRTLAVLTEADDIINTPDPREILDLWDKMKSREKWMRAGEYDDVRLLLSCRETFFGVLSSNPSLQESLRIMAGQVRSMEVEALVQTSTIGRKHGALQESLASVTYLSDIVEQCKSVGLDVEATAQYEAANVLWDQGEGETSIRMRQHLVKTTDFDSQTTDINLPVLLAKLGHHVADARLAKPDTIIKDYLKPAIQELKFQIHAPGSGQVFHEFASFCDKQLQNPEAAEELARTKTVMERKQQEHKDFMRLAKTESSKTLRDTYKRNAYRAHTWYKLDLVEYERLRQAREQFLQQCLENYLLCLQASDKYNNDALRVFSLWLEFSDSQLANDSVQRYIGKVPSGKFALLMNQLSSRLQAEDTQFQRLLSALVYRICREHPYHGMYQIFAIQMKVEKTSGEGTMRSKDESAKSRQRTAGRIAATLGNDKKAQEYWHTIYRAAEIYHALAMFKDQDKSRTEMSLDKYAESRALVEKIPPMNVPPATLQVEVRSNCDYTDLPVITGFKPKMSIANGLSAPKVITAYGSDGRSYKQLFKSGNDDLRQDAIMEQVFDQVSRLLKNHTTTRLRNLGIRTYKVLPLSTRSGLMEFVQNTIPLNNWLMPAHEKYYPSDYKPDKCRKEVAACQSDSTITRIKVWQKVADNFHPVLRYFFLERFLDPDEWFEKRLAYTRSTAAISILGHVLGLGDRHCHNILLDEKSGEVVHIDLGVSFEAGRVLPVPEVVPFRLTRDLVDAMGYTKTEGVFRRCCEFTMDTLREERESIMTLLNVLRYDPLVNWSVTPAKAKRMQEGQDASNNQQQGGRAGTAQPVGTPAPTPGPSVGVSGILDDPLQESHRKREEQAGEAGRALSVVEKKLSKGLSTPATVNELIQAATDERNLAVLYCGWASYA